MVHNLEDRPSFELILTVAGDQAVIISGWEDASGRFDVVAGIGDRALLPHYISVIKAACRQLEGIKRWEQVDDLRGEDLDTNESLPLPF